jgi:hypothetical protein
VAALDALSAPDKGILKANAEALFARFKDYKIATVTLGDMALKDVAPIFERINSTGTTLTIVDLMRAATWSPDFDLVDSIDAVRETLEEKGFGNIDRKIVLRNLSAACDGGFSVESIDTLREHDAARLKSAVGSISEAYKRAVDFLATHIGVPNGDIIPYVNQLVLLVEFFRLLPTPDAAEYRQIERWFWKTSLSGHFGGWNTGMMAEDQKNVQFFVTTGGEISVSTQLPDSGLWLAKQFRGNNAHAKLLAIILAHHRPLDLLTGQRIDTDKALAWTNSKEYHHFFPDAYLKALNVPPRQRNCLANFVMLSSTSNKTISDRAPSAYLLEVKRAAGANLADWLAGNLIPMPAFEAALRDDFAQFLELRANHLHSVAMALTTAP